MTNPYKTIPGMEYNRQDDEGLFEVEAVRSAVVKLEALVAVLAATNHASLIYEVENSMSRLFAAANKAEEEIRERQGVNR